METENPQELIPVEKLEAEKLKHSQISLTAWKKPHNFLSYYGTPEGARRAKALEPPSDVAEHVNLPTPMENGYRELGYRPPPWVSPSDIPGATRALDKDQGATTHPGPTLEAVQSGRVPPVCSPHLQVLCGPLLRYDTVVNDHWKGAVLIVTNDNESIYQPAPTLKVEWEPERLPPPQTRTPAGGGGAAEGAGEQPVKGSANGNPETTSPTASTPVNNSTRHVRNSSSQMGSSKAASSPRISTDSQSSPLSPSTFTASSEEYSDSEPASPTSPSHSRNPSDWAKSITAKLKAMKPSNLLKNDEFRGHPPVRKVREPEPIVEVDPPGNVKIIEAEAIYKYTGLATTATFWRFMISIPLSACDSPTSGLAVSYSVNGGQPITFHVAGPGEDLRFAAYSCNGFSAGIDPNTFKGEGFESGFDPVWADLLQRHEERPFHVLMGGGDQLYCDPLMSEPEMQDFVKLTTEKEKLTYAVSDAVKLAVDRFYFNHYCLVFRNGCFARAISSIPMINMLDDHDLIDGYGSYPDDLQRSQMFALIGNRGYFWFLLFQQFTVDVVDGTMVEPGQHTFKSTIIGADGPYIPYPSHSTIHWFGPHVRVVMLDARAERRRDLIVTPETYEQIFRLVRDQPPEVEHLILQLGIPIAYPRMNFAEKIMSSDGAIAQLAKKGLALPGLVNKYNKDMELLDDLSDHWTAGPHKKERNWFIQQLQHIALEKGLRVSFISGDVHVAGVGLFKTWAGRTKGKEIEPGLDHRWMANIISSGIVNTPPPAGAQAAVNMLAAKKHRTMHHADTDEVMVPIFEERKQGGKAKLKYIMGARNYTICERDVETGEYVFDIRVEKATGEGETKPYTIRVPRPQWKQT